VEAPEDEGGPTRREGQEETCQLCGVRERRDAARRSDAERTVQLDAVVAVVTQTSEEYSDPWM